MYVDQVMKWPRYDEMEVEPEKWYSKAILGNSDVQQTLGILTYKTRTWLDIGSSDGSFEFFFGSYFILHARSLNLLSSSSPY